ncbi:MAG: hypothetical protein ACXW6J_16345 [Candidatus Binatia bacterium]
MRDRYYLDLILPDGAIEDLLAGGAFLLEGRGEGGGQSTNREGLESRRKSAALKSFCGWCGCWDLSKLFSPLRLLYMTGIELGRSDLSGLSDRQFNFVHRLLFPALFVKLFADSCCFTRNFNCLFLLAGSAFCCHLLPLLAFYGSF